MKELVKDVLVALLLAVIIMQFIKPTIVRERSMEPNFHDGNYMFVSKQSYRIGDPKRGDVVIFKSELVDENGKEKLLIKRIIGLPGDRIAVKNDHVYLNGEVLDEPYTNDGITDGYVEEMEIPEDSYFCMGDNRLVSIDSRDPAVGCVERDKLVGKVFLRLFPFSQIGFVHNPYSE